MENKKMVHTLCGIVSAVALAVMFVGCGGGGGKPENVALEFTKHMSVLNVDAAAKFIPKDKQSDIKELKEFIKEMGVDTKSLPKWKLSVKNVDIDGDEAEVEILCKNNDDEETVSVTLEKIKGKWVVMDSDLENILF